VSPFVGDSTASLPLSVCYGENSGANNCAHHVNDNGDTGGFHFLPLPTIVSFEPKIGQLSGGTTVTFKLADGQQGATCKFNEVNVVDVVDNACTSPPGEAGIGR